MTRVTAGRPAGALASADFQELRLDGIGREFGRMHALRAVSLTVTRGEFIALLGPSGCGKSTALNCIAGLLALTAGAIWLDERRIDGLRPERRGFGMVFQSYALFPHMTVRDNVGFGLAMRRVPKAEAGPRIEEAIRLVQLAGHEGKLPGQLSGGQQQRVAIARAIVVRPPLVLMDEPLSNLDAKLRLEMRLEMRRIHEQLGSTTIYVTHDQDEALSLADRIVVMRAGQVRQVGTPEALYARPAHLDVAEFMGFRNRLPGRLVAFAGEQARVAVAGTVLDGTAREPLGSGGIVAAIRPDDLAPVPEGGIPATVTAVEYRGREFHGTATTGDGIELGFAARQRPVPGDAVRLAAPPDRVLVFAADGVP